MSDVLSDLKFALRTLRKNPTVTVVAVLTLALGISVNATMYSCLNALLLRPFPYRDPDQLVALRDDNPTKGINGASVSYPNFVDWRANNRSLVGMTAFSGNSFNLAAKDGVPEQIEGGQITWDTFQLLGVQPVLGRNFRAEEDRPNAERVAMLAYDLWQRRFDGDRAILGKTISLNGDTYTIVGVMPSGFGFPNTSALWVPLALDPTQNRGMHFLNALARLKPGVTMEKARADLASISRRLESDFPESNAGWTLSMVSLHEQNGGDYRSVLYIMMGAVAFVLLIACANVANLLLARATTRSREMAIRAALGAGRGRIIRQLLIESLAIAIVGGALGALLAVGFLKLVVAGTPPDRPFWMVFAIDRDTLLYTLVLCLTTGLLFGLAPALQASGSALHESLKEGGRSGGSGAGRQRLRSGLVVVEVALSLVLLVGAGLMVQSFLKIQNVDPGFDRSNVLTMRVSLAGKQYDSTSARSAFYQQVLARAAALPGVQQAAMINSAPLSGNSNYTDFEVDGQTFPVGRKPTAAVRGVSANYFKSLRVPLRKGRLFVDHETWDSSRVTIVNETMATRFWPGKDAIGQRVAFNGDTSANKWYTIVGVVGDVHLRRLTSPPDNDWYLPYSAMPRRTMTIMVRTSGDAASLAPPMRDAVRSVDANMPVFSVRTMQSMYDASMWDRRLYGWMFAAFGGIALLLAAVGLYSVIAYMVAQRTREIGVRMALGARRADVVRLVLNRGLVLTGTGLLIGGVAAFAVMRTLKGLLFGVSSAEPLTFVGVAALLGAVAIAASVVPARRASTVDPAIALRNE
ncbi:MAG: ABC transporter permease [Gemmatimonadota bacterium]|nr:ABC transporter permease [Gemmatimonadota bacterium]